MTNIRWVSVLPAESESLNYSLPSFSWPSVVPCGLMRISVGFGDNVRQVNYLKRKLLLRIAKAGNVAWFDTAQQYGSGEGERVLRRAYSGARVITKIGLWKDYSSNDCSRWLNEFSATKLEQRVEASLQRLRRSHIDVVLLHCTSAYVDFESHARVLGELVRDGVIGRIGFSADSLEQVPSNHSWASILETNIGCAEEIDLRRFEVVVINQFFRSEGNKARFNQLVRRNPDQKFVLLIGSSKLSRILKSLSFARALQDSLKSGHHV